MTTTATRKTFIERTGSGFQPDVDREAGIIRNVKFLGSDSENGRHYGYKVRQESIDKYEGVAVHLNHPKGRKLERDVQDWVGTLENVRAEPDGNYGDLRLRKKHTEFEALIEAATHFWENFGLSHVAFGDGKMVNGIEVVEAIEDVRSVDIVTEPATCSNLFESRGRRPAVSSALMESRRRTAELQARLAELERDQAELGEIEQRHARLVERAQRTLDERRARYRR